MEPSSTDYAEATKDLQQFGNILCGLIQELLHHANIQVHSVSCRVKDIESATKKLVSNPEKYTNFSELTDLLGIRVITYFSEDVDKVAQALTQQFKIDRKNSTDKRKSLDPDRFGYLSLHFVASLNSQRSRLLEYKRFLQMRFELQIRSILQHAWAEIEHDLGYKIEGALPSEMRRSFSRLAGMLELADEEFTRLREGIYRYEDLVSSTIQSSPENLKIDQSTVAAALENEKLLIDLDKSVAQIANRPLAAKVDPDQAGDYARELKFLGVKDIKRLYILADRYKEYVKHFANIWIGDRASFSRTDQIHRGIGLFYLNYILAAQLSDEEISRWGQNIRGRNDSLLDRVRETWAQVVTELGNPKDS